MIEIHREPTKVPYRVSRDIGRVEAGHIFVRHGSHTEPPTEDEVRALEEEGQRASAAA